MDPKHTGEIPKHSEKQDEMLGESHSLFSHESHKLQVEEEKVMSKNHELLQAEGLNKKNENGDPIRNEDDETTAKIDSDRKRKKSSISSADQTTAKEDKHKDKGHTNLHHHHHHHHHHKKKSKMSSSASGIKVRASHILIKHQGSRRKASWKDPEGRVISETTRDAAVSQLQALRDDIISGETKFADVASRYSDCSSAKRGGDLGPFGKGQMQKPFEDATYSLKIGEMSDIVDTDSGVHIIMRTG